MRGTPGRGSLVGFAWLSIGASLVIICLKAYAYWITGSVGLLSDALESLVNLAAACVALIALTIAARPADDDHPYGHEKAEYFSSGVEGGMILVAAIGIAISAIDRFLHPQPLEHVPVGLAVSLIATIINFAVARVLLAAAHRHDSIALEADARHLMTDVWTSVGVVIGVGAADVTGWNALDAAVALAVALNIVWTGVSLVRRSARGLMDTALPDEEQTVIRDVLESYRREGSTRRAASRRFVDVHILVPGAWTVQRGHDLLERIESDIRGRLPNATVFTHIEPIEDPASWRDTALDPAEISDR
jgi:cation diffusion facilitator family transporter